MMQNLASFVKISIMKMTRRVPGLLEIAISFPFARGRFL
jgi:hypothetical protein